MRHSSSSSTWSCSSAGRRSPASNGIRTGSCSASSCARVSSPPTELEDPAPPTFAQGVGFAITLVGLALHLLNVPYALVVAAAAAFVAAFLNSVFGLCLGCQLYVLLVRAGLLGRKKGAATTA